MAVQFLNDIDLNQNELIDAVIENQTGDTPAGTGVDGQLYYDTTLDVLKVWTGAAWTSVGSDTYTLTGTGAGNGTAKVRLSDGTTNNDVAFTGTGSVIVTRSGNTLTINGTDNQGVTIITAGAGITGSNLASSNPTIDVDYLGTDNVILAATDGTTATVASTDKILINDFDDSNTVKYVNISQITAAIGGGTVTSVTAGTGMTQTGDASVNPTLNVIGSSGILANADNIAIDYTATGIINDANPGTGITLANTDEFLFEDATSAAGTAVKRGTLSQLKTYIGAVTGVTSVNFTTDGTALNVVSNTITSAGTMTGIWQGSSAQYVNGAGDLATFPTIGDGQIDGRTSGIGISGSMDATANQSGNTTFTVTSNATSATTVSTLMSRDSSGFSNVITPSSGDSSTKVATTAFVQAAVTGLLQFKGGFNADTGILDDASGDDLYTDVVIEVGDYYVVTNAGDFFGNTATPLTVGDSVIAQKAVPDPGTTAAVEADFIVVQSDTDLATNSTVGLMFINPTGTGITSNIAAGAATLTNTDKGSSQAIYKNVVADSGGTATASSNNDSITIAGGSNVSTVRSGDTITINATDTNTQRAAGTGLSLSGNTINANVDGTQSVAANASSSTADKTYKVQVDSSDQLVVNVPWENDDTGLTSVGITETGSALTITNSPLTSNGNINIAGAGTASQVILGNLTLGTLTSGTVTSIATTGPITGGTITGSGTIGISNATSGAVGAARVSAGTGISVAVAGGNFTVTNTQNNSDNTFAETITDTDLTIDHNLGTTDVIVQLYDVTEGVTVYADVDRISANRIGVTFGSTPPNSVRVLVQKIG